MLSKRKTQGKTLYTQKKMSKNKTKQNKTRQRFSSFSQAYCVRDSRMGVDFSFTLLKLGSHCMAGKKGMLVLAMSGSI